MLAYLRHWLPSSRTEQAALVLLGLCLVTLPEFSILTKHIRSSILIILAGFMLIHPVGRFRLRQNFFALPRSARITLILLGCAMLPSTALGDTAIVQRLLGYAGDNEGLLTWLAYLILGLGLSHIFRAAIENRLLPYLLSGLLAVMLAIDLPDLLQGFRFSGFLYQATGMGIWCALLLFWVLAKTPTRRREHWLRLIALILTCLGLFLSQSRIAIILSTALLALQCLHYLRMYQIRRVIPAFIILLFLIITPFLNNAVFVRLHSRAVEQGVSYRADLYELGLQRIANGHLLLGTGASSADTILNDGHHAKPIQDTLDQGFVFWYAHDLFLDTGLLFGGIAALCLLYLTLYATWCYYRSRSFLMISTWALLLGNALVNTPSLELTSLFFIALFFGIVSKDSILAPVMVR